jgi:hypothetical protein
MYLARLHFVDPDGGVCFRVNPKKWVRPVVGELNLDQVLAGWASRPIIFKNSVWAAAAAISSIKNKSSSFVPGSPRWAAGFAQSFHALQK